MTKVDEALKKASSPGFWGQIQVDYRDGKPAVIRVIETTNLRDEEKRSEKTYRY